MSGLMQLCCSCFQGCGEWLNPNWLTEAYGLLTGTFYTTERDDT